MVLVNSSFANVWNQLVSGASMGLVMVMTTNWIVEATASASVVTGSRL